MILSEVAQASGLFLFAPLMIGFPILGLLINLVLGRRLGERFVGIVASSAIGLSFLTAVLQFFALQGAMGGTQVPVADWISIGNLEAAWILRVDTLSTAMAMMVSGVSALIHIYATRYMHEDVRWQGDPGRYTRFFVFFNLFVAMMMILVMADNMLMMFVGWEGVGLCSYLLIGFWYDKGEDGIGNAIAGKKAFIVNRIGDFGFLIAMFLTFWAFGSLQFDVVGHQVESIEPGILTAITLFLLLGVTGKSAQLPLFIWLPDAMAGPTPVSALIHAATMVTSGIYMITRNHALFDAAPISGNVVAIVGGATALFSATIAVGQFDIKKVLAYSTISQLGFMVAAVGLGAYVAGMFHLIAHAFFKALLFLSAGSVIQGVEHGLHHVHHGEEGGHHDFDPQDMRNMGGLRGRMKITTMVYMLGALALAGIPPLVGFFSKDEILADASAHNPLVYVLLTAAAFLTAFYMGRQIFMVFFGQARSPAAAHAQENPPAMTVPLMALAALSVLGGGLNLPGLHSLTEWFEHTLEHIHPGEFNLMVAAISSALALLAIGLAWLLYGRRTMQEGQVDPLRRILGPVFVCLENKWWVDELYHVLFVRSYERLAAFLAHVVDWQFWHDWFHDSVLVAAFRGGARWLAMDFDLLVIDGAFNGLARAVGWCSDRLRVLQTGYVRNYALSIFVGVVLVLSYVLFL